MLPREMKRLFKRLREKGADAGAGISSFRAIAHHTHRLSSGTSGGGHGRRCTFVSRLGPLQAAICRVQTRISFGSMDVSTCLLFD